ncbi:RAC family serine/threonine-protein kinase like protein [Tritrichomonas foetus]|uniref:RAC family serine/threonine-protein kinase like protein n=1 Tax=Tritrichomonas foetus TaxID=1144522 RepID=A0A1J4KY76_9EUKA|nr:RAC family serine/threonine-protein kinase like protein [Tritrichomonas foetus]|eukprot:OHT15840.1 RAC family serine/threonine-protein kinase like protein [Tritrichomonas foetus]
MSKCGWLMIRRSFSKGWHRRFLKLNGCFLIVSTDTKFTQIKERIYINNNVKIALTSSTSFNLIMPDSTTYLISAGQPEDLIEWINALKQADQSNYEIDIDSFELIKVIGEGHFSKVYLARMITTDEYIALKVSERKDIAYNEKNIISKLTNPFIIGFKFYFEFDDKSYLGLEYTAAGDLFSRFEYEISKRDAKIYASELLIGMKYLHSQGIVIRDFKPENILLCTNGHLKLADFGLAKFLKNENNTTRTICGTADYSAPEVVKNEEYGKPADVWSYGVVLYELLFNCSPFYSENELKMYEKITEGSTPIPEGAEPDEIEIIQACLKKDPKERPTFDELKKFSFFSEVDWDLIIEKRYETDFIPEAVFEDPSSDVMEFEYYDNASI